MERQIGMDAYVSEVIEHKQKYYCRKCRLKYTRDKKHDRCPICESLNIVHLNSEKKRLLSLNFRRERQRTLNSNVSIRVYSP